MNPAFSLDELRKRIIGAFISEATPDKPVYGTVIAAALGNRINFFSTTAFRTPDGLIIDINEDNRQSITTMVDYLAGERLDPEPKRSGRAAKLATDLILSR